MAEASKCPKADGISSYFLQKIEKLDVEGS